jgi:hypothetical protein
MPRNIAIVLGCAVVALSLAATSQAATVIDFTQYAGLFTPKPPGDLITLTDGKTLQLDAFDEDGNDRYVAYTDKGLGAWFWDNDAIDGLGDDETLRMTFSEQITLQSFTLQRVNQFLDWDDDARVIIDYQSNSPIDFDLAGLGKSPTLTLAEVGTVFDFTVIGWEDDYVIKSITIADAPGGTPIGVPAPAALLAGGGLLGLIVGRRRR